ncbi:phage portal protein [Dietzia sp. ANT_WB102]|nr:phage portal protein [Dietzia sp. ANT_WB102]
MGKSADTLWKEQPHLRTVIDFLARNVAQLGVHAFEMQGDEGRVRMRDGLLPAVLRRPNPEQTGYEFWRAVVSDLALYDSAYIMVIAVEGDGYHLRTIRPSWVTSFIGADAYSVSGYVVKFPGTDRPIEVPAENVVAFHGWNPVDELTGSSPVNALRSILTEQIQAQLFREQVWRRAGRVGTYLTRPKDAAQWSKEGRTRFKEQWSSAYSNNGAAAGATPVLEDGMELKRVGFSAKEEEYIDGTKLALSTVAAVYHVNPTMVGLLDNANYSNVREFRRMLYGETLGPIIAHLEGRLNSFLLPKLGYDDPSVYVEFNTEARLRGSFEEQAQVMQASIGGPWMTINEGRARQNLPAVEGGDALIRPLNVTQNGSQTPIPAASVDDSNDGGDEG